MAGTVVSVTLSNTKMLTYLEIFKYIIVCIKQTVNCNENVAHSGYHLFAHGLFFF